MKRFVALALLVIAPIASAQQNPDWLKYAALYQIYPSVVNGDPSAMRSGRAHFPGQQRVARCVDGPLWARVCNRRGRRSPEAQGLRPSQRSSAAQRERLTGRRMPPLSWTS